MATSNTESSLDMVAKGFGDKLKSHDRRDFESCKLENLQEEIDRIQQQRARTYTMMNMTRLEMFLRKTTQLGEMFAVTNTAGRERAMALLWGSIRFILKVQAYQSSKITDPIQKAFDNVLDTYEKLGVHIPYVAQYEHIFAASPEYEECLVNIYRDVQRFHYASYQLFSLRQKLWQQLHRPIWKDLKHTFSQIFSSLDSHTRFIEQLPGSSQSASVSTASSLAMTSSSTPNVPNRSIQDSLAEYRVDVKHQWMKFEEDEDERKNKQREKTKRRIPSSAKLSGLHEDFLKRKCPDTGRWLFRSYGSVFNWMNLDAIPDSAIWLHGSKGYGKTILASSMVEELKQGRDKQQPSPKILQQSNVYYFYCLEDDEENRTFLGLLKGILAQMIDRVSYIIPLCEEKLSSGGGDNLSKEVFKTLVEAFIEYGPRQYIVIDGLNECETSEAADIAEFFLDQAIKCDTYVRQGQLRVLFTSQAMPNLKAVPELKGKLPEGRASIELNSKDNAADIKTYVKQRMKELSNFNLTKLDEENIEGTVCHQSGDMFLFAHLAMEYLLQQSTKGDILDKSRKELMPESLPEMYEKLIGSLRSSLESVAQWEKAKLLLGWLVCAKRSLLWHELQSILSFDVKEKVMDLDNKMLRQDVRKYLGSMVHILKSGHIRLIHPTVRRFIVKNIHINEVEVQYQLTGLCLGYLSSPCFSEECDNERRKNLARTGYFSFQDYACAYWHCHIESFIRDCGPSLETSIDRQFQDDFYMSLEGFFDIHGQSLATEFHRDFEQECVNHFGDTRFYENLRTLWNHIFTHQMKSFEDRNTVGIPQIEKGLQKNRKVIEDHFSPTDVVCNKDTIEDYYGPNLFKCKQTLCDFFYEGFDDLKRRDKHENRHDRPYPCPAKCNMAPIGFPNQKDRERHVRVYHPELSERPSMFEDPFRRQETGSFVCQICKKTFTRRENLKGHERSHFGNRPFPCHLCGKAFARSSDCRRHERNQSCKFGGRRERTSRGSTSS